MYQRVGEKDVEYKKEMDEVTETAQHWDSIP